jgi:thioredoxin reductase
VVDAGSPRNAAAAHLHGFLSRDGLAPADLVSLGRDEVAGYGGDLVDGSVSKLLPDGASGFWVRLADGRQLSARRLLVTTGLRDELPNIDGLAERWARDVLHCPYCHGYEVRDRQLGVIGGSSEAVRYAQIVRQWSPDVAYFTPFGMLTATERAQLVARGIGVVEGDVVRVLVEHDQLQGVALAHGRTVPREVLFVPPDFLPNNDLLRQIGCQVDINGWVVKDANGATSRPGVWVAGNVANPRAQLITAAGEGSAAAIAINADLVGEDVSSSVRDFNLGLVP